MFRIFISILCIVFFIAFSSSSMAQTPSSEKKEKEKPAEQILIEKGGVLLSRGTLQIEPGLQYSHFSRHRISISGFTILEAIVIGEIAVHDLKRDILQAALTARYGITSRFEAELKVPYLFRWDRDVRAPETTDVSEKNIHDSGIGDIEGALYYHLITAKGWVPDLILNVRAKARNGKDPYGLRTDAQGSLEELPMGNGHWGFSGGFTVVKVSDPAVFFGSLAYFWNVRRNVGQGIGTIDPGDSVEASLGVAYALSEKFSLSTQYQQRISVRTKQNGQRVPGTFINAGTIFLGGSYNISKKTSVNLSVGLGLTTDAPDVQVVWTVPFNL